MDFSVRIKKTYIRIFVDIHPPTHTVIITTIVVAAVTIYEIMIKKIMIITKIPVITAIEMKYIYTHITRTHGSTNPIFQT